MDFKHFLGFGLIGAAALTSGCGGSSSNSSSSTPATVDAKLKTVISSLTLTGDPSTARSIPSIESPKAQLGMKLFFSKALGGDQDSACVTCHHPALGGGDDLSLSIGVEADVPDLLGPGRAHSSAGTHFDGGPTVPRNAPTTFNIALYDQVLFHDGRVESLTKTPGANGSDGGIRTPDSSFGEADPNAGANLTVAQARFPVTSAEEMRGFTLEAGNSNAEVRTHLEQRLQNTLAELSTNNWLEEFRSGFGNETGTAETLITFDNIVDAIAEYENSQIFVDTPWKAYIAGDTNAISDDAKEGALLFYGSIEEGGANCATCHSGDFFTDEKFHAIAIPQIGRGKGNDNGTVTSDDFGRFRETGNEDDRYAFRTPALLNVTETGPWGHSGAYTTLEGVVRHHLNPEVAIGNYNFNQLDANIQVEDFTVNTQAALTKLLQNQSDGKSLLVDVSLTDTQVNQLLAFLATLTDSCVTDRNCLASWIPKESDTDPDSLRVNAVDSNSTPL